MQRKFTSARALVIWYRGGGTKTLVIWYRGVPKWGGYQFTVTPPSSSQPPYFTIDLRILAYTWPAEPRLGLERLRCVRACVVHEMGVAVGMLGTNGGFQRQQAGRRVKVVISGLSRPDRDGWQVWNPPTHVAEPWFSPQPFFM